MIGMRGTTSTVLDVSGKVSIGSGSAIDAIRVGDTQVGGNGATFTEISGPFTTIVATECLREEAVYISYLKLTTVDGKEYEFGGRDPGHWVPKATITYKVEENDNVIKQMIVSSNNPGYCVTGLTFISSKL